MVSSKEILQQTGLKNIKTLTRWYQKGIIPKPYIQTHPSGRGKMAYWPNWVLDHCLKIIKLRKQGYSVKDAVLLIDYEATEKELDEVKKKPLISDELDKKHVKLKSGKEISLLDVFIAVIMDDLRHLITDRSIRNLMVAKFKKQKGLDLALACLDAGYNPVLLFDGTNLEVTPDFYVGHLLSYKPAAGNSRVVLQLLKPLEKAFSLIGKELKVGSLAYPAPKIRIRQGDALVEYDIALMGINGFELIRQSAKTIGGSNVPDRLKEGSE